MRNGHRYLKVKIKSLATEARIIKQEERKAKGRLREGLYLHRVGIVRDAARLTQLVYGFLRGRKYRQIENSDKYINRKKVFDMIEKYGPCCDWENGETSIQFKERSKDLLIRAKEWLDKRE